MTIRQVYDKFGVEIEEGNLVDVQKAGMFVVYVSDGELCFYPYAKTELVWNYFSNDLINVSKLP